MIRKLTLFLFIYPFAERKILHIFRFFTFYEFSVNYNKNGSFPILNIPLFEIIDSTRKLFSVDLNLNRISKHEKEPKILFQIF